MMSVASADTVSSMQALSGPFSPGDSVICGGYYAPGDGGGGVFTYDGTAITGAALLTASITGATNAKPIVITASNSFVNGQSVLIEGVEGNAAANGTWLISGRTAGQFALVGSSGNGSYTSGGAASSVNITAAHHLVAGQAIAITRNSASGINARWLNIGVYSSTVFSIPTNIAPGTGGTFGDGGRSIPSTATDGRWVRVSQTLNVRFYGARCDGSSDDGPTIQAMFDANPGGHFVFPGSLSTPCVINVGSTTLVPKGQGWIIEGGGSTYNGSGYGGTTLKWSKDVTGIRVLNANTAGTIREMNLLGGNRFSGASSVPWPDAIVPNFTDPAGGNIFACSIGTMSRTSNVVTVVVAAQGVANEPNHNYVVGTQITISGVSAHSDMNGVYYITAIGQSVSGRTGFNTFSYANNGSDIGSFAPATGLCSPSTTGSTADGIQAGSNFLRLENLNLQSWGRCGINAFTDSSIYFADDQSFRSVTISNCRGIGLSIRGGDANASDYYQIASYLNLVGGICDVGFLGNTHVAHNVTQCGGDWSSTGGLPIGVSSLSCTNNVVTVTTVAPHGFSVGNAVVLSGLADPTFQAPIGSAVFVATVDDSTHFTCAFTHPDGTTSGGSARFASGTEVFTAAGVGQHTDGSKGSGFSYWVGGILANRVMMQCYAESANGPLKIGPAVLVIGGALGGELAPWYTYPSIQANGGRWASNLLNLDSGLNGASATHDFGTTVSLRGGHFAEQPNEIDFFGHSYSVLRWVLRDESNGVNPYIGIVRHNQSGPKRLALYKGSDTYSPIAASRSGNVVTMTTSLPHGIAFGNYVMISGVIPSSFNGTFQVIGSETDRTFQYNSIGPDQSASAFTPGGISCYAANFRGESHLSGEGTGAVVLNPYDGTGGVRFGDGAGHDAAKIDSAGKIAIYKGISTVANGVPAEYAQVNLTGQSSSVGTTTTYAVPSSGAGIYRISYYLKVTRAATTSSSVTLTLGSTDADDGTALTTVTGSPANATDGTGVVQGVVVVNAKLSTSITHATTYASSGATSMQYTLRIRVEAL